MPDYRILERQLSERLNLQRRRDHVPGRGAFRGAEIRRLGAVGVQLLASGHERPGLLYGAGRPSQLPDRQLHPQHPAAPGTGPRARADADVDGRHRLHPHGEGRRDSRLPRTPGAVVYAPLGETPVDPDVVLFAGRPGRVMLLQEAALRAGVGAGVPLLARPTCMAIPAALAKGAVASTACIGNRVYTDVGEDELWVVMPGKDLARVADELRTITDANTKLSEYHRGRRRALATE